MILFSIIFQIFSLFMGLLEAKQIIKKKQKTVSFENAYKQSNAIIAVTFIALSIIFIGASSIHYDAFFLLLPLLYQKYAMIITWTTIIGFIAFFTGFILPLTQRFKAKKFKAYSIALLILNILLQINHYQKNAYHGDEVKENNNSDIWVNQTTNFSCTSASIASIARSFDINISEREVAQLSRLTKFGANAGQVRFTLSQLGIKYHSLTAQFTEPKKIKAPAILYVDNTLLGYESHAVVYLGKGRYGYELWNPLNYKEYLSESEFKEIWHGRGIECFRE